MLIRREISEGKLLAAKHRRMMREYFATYAQSYAETLLNEERDHVFLAESQRPTKIRSELRIKMPVEYQRRFDADFGPA